MNGCPSPECLQHLLSGELRDPLVTTVREHVRACTTCQSMLDLACEDGELRSWMSNRAWQERNMPAEPGLDQLLAGIRCPTPPIDDATYSTEDVGACTLSFLRVPQGDNELGRLGGYRIDAELGRGGMGIVLRGFDPELDRFVAIKVLRPDRADDMARARFVREAKAAARVNHRNIVAVHAVSNPPDAPAHIVMEYIAGPSLRDRIANERLDPREAADIVAQVADGLAAAHAAGLVHRDIKPSNVLLEQGSGFRVHAKLTDFGLARITALSPGSTLTQEGMLAGTPAYMGPEQVVEPDRLDPRSDVYSLGATLYEALTGEVPFRGTPQMVLRQIGTDEPRAPRQLNDAVPRDLETICLKAMAKEPGRRYQTASALADDLRCWLRGEPIVARAIGAPDRAWRWCRRNPRVATLAASLVLSLLFGLAGIFWQWRRAEASLVAARGHQQAAERRDRDARAAVDQYYTELAGAGLQSMKGLNELREKLLKRALQYYEQRAAQESSQSPAILAELAEAHSRLAHLHQYMGNSAESLAGWKNSAAIYEVLAQINRDVPQQHQNLAFSYRAAGRQLQILGRDVEAIEFIEKARAAAESFAERHPDEALVQIEIAKAHCHIGIIHWVRGDKAGAIERHLKSLAIWESLDITDDYQLNERAKVYVNLGEYLLPDRPLDAIDLFHKASAQYEELRLRTPANTEYSSNLAVTYTDIGNAQASLGYPIEASEAFEQAHRIYQEVLEEDRSFDEIKLGLANCCRSIGKLQRQTGQWDVAVASLERARKGYEEIARKNPTAKDAQVGLIETWITIAEVRCVTGDLEGAISALQEAIGHGFHDRDRLYNNPLLAAVQTHSEFLQLLAGLGTADEAHER